MSTFKKHLTAILAGEVTKSNVIGLKKATSAFERKSAGYSVSSTAPDWSVAEMQQVARALKANQPAVTGELHETGLKQLRDRRYASQWSEKQQGIIDRLDHFKLIGIISVGRRSYAAVFKAVDVTGQSFCFYNIPWQTAQAEGLLGGPHVIQERI